MQHELIADLMLKHMLGTANFEENAQLETWKREKPERKQQVESWAIPEQLKSEFELTYPGVDEMENLKGRLNRLING